VTPVSIDQIELSHLNDTEIEDSSHMEQFYRMDPDQPVESDFEDSGSGSDDGKSGESQSEEKDSDDEQVVANPTSIILSPNTDEL
jgi:hypothetical protein